MLHNFPDESTSLALRLLILALCLSQTSFSLPSLFTYKQTVWIPLFFIVAITIFKKQFTRNWALPIHYGRKIIMLWNSWKQAPMSKLVTTATSFLARFPAKKNSGCTNPSHDFPPRKYDILLPRRADTWFPSSPQRVHRRTCADVITKISRMDSLPIFLGVGFRARGALRLFLIDLYKMKNTYVSLNIIKK